MAFSKYAVGRRAMVVSGHEAATQSATTCLEQGGSLADAALTGAAVLTVALPHACGLGGDAFMLIHDAETGKTHGVNASGISPALATPDLFSDGVSDRGPLSCNVPGMVAGWQALHDRFGTMSWSDVLNPAILLAKNGVEVSSILAESTVLHKELLLADAGSRSLFLSDGAPLRAGQTLVQPQLAQTLATIAQAGGQAFYQGELAKSIVNACKSRGGLLRMDDFAAYKPEWVDPISTAYREHEVFTLPPNSYGIFLLLQMMALEDTDASSGQAIDDPLRFAKLIHAAQAAFAVGSRAVADPDPKYGAESVQSLLGPDGLARLISANPGTPANRGGTAVISVADHKGNAVTIIQSVFFVFGSSVSDADTGTLLNNRLFGFTADTSHPNVVGPRKRPAHTLCPAMVFKDGQLRHVISTPGGPGQTLTLAQVIQALIEGNATLRDAIDAPRWSMGLAGELLSENSMSADIIAALADRNIIFDIAAPGTPFFGSVKGISFGDDGVITGVADGRRNATAHGID